MKQNSNQADLLKEAVEALKEAVEAADEAADEAAQLLASTALLAAQRWGEVPIHALASGGVEEEDYESEEREDAGPEGPEDVLAATVISQSQTQIRNIVAREAAQMVRLRNLK